MYNSRLEAEIKRNLKTYSAEELYSEYGIILKDKGHIFDEVSQRLYHNANDWIYDYLNDTGGNEFEKFQSPMGFDDDY